MTTDRPALPEIPMQGDERTMLNAFLDNYRATLLDQAWGLTHEQLQIPLPPTSLTLSRLIGHMAYVEYIWFRERFDGEPRAEPYASMDWDADFDSEMTLAQTWTTEELFAKFNEAVEDSRRRVAAAESLDQLSARPSQHPSRNGEHWNLRWIMNHMIEEYARHCGHADLIRESIDGDTARYN